MGAFEPEPWLILFRRPAETVTNVCRGREKEGSMRESQEQRLQGYFSDALQILARSTALAQGEQPFFYRVAALQLRLLLCDTTRRHNRIENIALAARLFPQAGFVAPGPGFRFEPGAAKIPLAAWLEQPLPVQPPLTVRQFIRKVCDLDGGAHVDLRDPAGLPPPDVVQAWVLALARHAYEQLAPLPTPPTGH